MYTPTDIQSIGWLNTAGGNVRLSPIINGNATPTFLTVPRSKISGIECKKEKLKELACEILNEYSAPRD